MLKSRGIRCLESNALEGHYSTLITGGGKLQKARAEVDFIKVNFHTYNFAIIDNILAPLSEIDHALRNELCGLSTNA